MRERLEAAREASGQLQESRTRLMRRMRDSLRELRTLRERLLDGHARRGTARGPDPVTRLARKYQLTPRELEVALLLSGGASNAKIAGTLGISEHTARHHTHHVLVKLGVHSRARAGTLLARELGRR